MSVVKVGATYPVERLAFSSSKPMDEVLNIVRQELSEAIAGPQLPLEIKAATSAAQIQQIVLNVTDNGKHDFVSFGESQHSAWMDVYYQRNFTPTVVFTLGNPLLAKEIMKYDMEAGLHIPPQMIVQQTEKGGTKISYDVPSTIMPGAKKPSKGMMASMKTVDQKLEKLVRKVLAV